MPDTALTVIRELMIPAVIQNIVVMVFGLHIVEYPCSNGMSHHQHHSYGGLFLTGGGGWVYVEVQHYSAISDSTTESPSFIDWGCIMQPMLVHEPS